MRQPDSTLPAGERLFRGVCPRDLVDGDRVLKEAIDLPATSCDREAYAVPESVLVPGRPEDTGVIAVRVDDLPGPTSSPSGVPYDWIASDDPLESNDAHAEVRLRRAGAYDPGHRPSSKPFRERLRAELAARFRVVIAPK